MTRNFNAIFHLIRKVVFGVVSLFALIVIVMAGLIISHSNRYVDYYDASSGLGIATGILTILTLPVMLFLSITRKGAIASMIAIEISWTLVLWILWLCVGSLATGPWDIGDCSSYYFSASKAACRETEALTAFAFTNWILLLFYNIALFVLVIRQHMRGNPVWTNYVNNTDYTAHGQTAPGHPAAIHSTEPKAGSNFAPQYPPATTTPVSYSGKPAPPMTSPYPEV